MLNNVVSFSNSIGYLIHANLEFDYNYYYNNFCGGMSREQVANKFKEDLQNALFDPAAINPVATKWIQEQLDYGFPLMNANEVDEFWILHQDKKQYYNKLNRQADYENNLQEIYTRTRASSLKSTASSSSRASSSRSTTSSRSPQSLVNQNVVEGDSLIFFNDRSISSILKSYGKQLFEVYESLSVEEQSLCGYCLNGILDLTNQKKSGQKKLFTNDQWDYLLKHLGSKKMKHLPKLSDPTKKKVEDVVKEIKNGQEEEAYYVALESIRGAHPADKWIFKILGHVINAYRERSYVFTNPTNKISELDFLMKVWGEVLELLVGDSSELYVNWGETTAETTTAVKRVNNDNKPHTIGCKVDGRIVCKVSKIVDTCHIEAARASSGFHKVYSDKFKLAAESKCTIDDLVMTGKIKKQKAIILQSMQIFGIQADVCSLKLIDRGLYVNSVEFDLSFCSSLKLFADKLIMWIQQLKSLKQTCLSNAALSSDAFYTQPASFSEIFHRDDSDGDNSKYCSREWVTGTFLPPTSKPAILPKQLLTSTSTLSRNRSVKRKLPVFYLDDDTKVISKFNKQQKRQHNVNSEN